MATMAGRLVSIYERIAADYPHYTIHREHDDNWIAAREYVRVHAGSPSCLVVKLQEQELARLRRKFGDLYRIWRTSSLWVATRRVDDGTERTLIRDTPAELEEGMHDPPKGIGRITPLL